MKNGKKKKISTLGFFTILAIIVTLIVTITFILHDKYGFFQNDSTENIVVEDTDNSEKGL